MKWESTQRDVPVLEVLGEAVVVGHARVIRRLLVVVGAQWRTVGRGLDALGANSCREERRRREKEREGPKAAWHVVEPNAASLMPFGDPHRRSSSFRLHIQFAIGWPRSSAQWRE